MMLAARGAIRASGAGLPYDAEVEYIESSGTQYINTGIKPGPNTRVEITFAMTTFTANCGLFGARGSATADNNSYNLFIISNNGSRIRWDWSGSGQYQTSEADTSTDATYVLGAAGGNITRNGTTVMSVSASKAAINYPLYVFNFNNVGTPYSTGANARFWSVKIYEGQTLVFDAIPVRKKTVGYLYDRVSGKLFGNAGTGDFMLGPDVVPVEYIESHGTEYIDTGFNITNATSFSYDAKFSLASTISNSEPRLFSNEGAGSGAYYDIYFSTSANILNIRQSGTTAQISRRDVPIVSTMDEQGNYRGYYEDEPQSLLYNATRAFVAPTTDRDYRIFSRGNNTGSKFLWQGKLYWLNFTKNGEPSRRYRPVRVGTDATSWEGAMMDVLTRRIYRNAGTGAFAYGNDLKYPIPA